MPSFMYGDRLVRMSCETKSRFASSSNGHAELSFNSAAILTSSSPFKTKLEPERIRQVSTMNCSKVLEAPGIEDDFYTQILSWSSKNVVAVALKPNIYLYHPDSAKVQSLQVHAKGNALGHGCAAKSSLSWNIQGDLLAVGHKNGILKVWDMANFQCIKEVKLHSNRIATLSWNENILSTGSKDCSIQHLDMRMKRPLFSSRWHAGEVCGLKWNRNGTQLVSGGDDNQVCIWDIRKGNEPNWHIRDFNGAVKAIDWSPADPTLFVTGGGSTDRRIKIWSTKTNSCLDIVDTGSQICSIIWSKVSNQIISSHGFIENDIIVWKYPKLIKTFIFKGHSLRVLHTAISPDHNVIASTSGDETLRLWKLHDSSSKFGCNFSDRNLFCKILK